MIQAFLDQGFVRLPPDPALVDWIAVAAQSGQGALADPRFADQHACEGTWFVGVDALANDATGAVDPATPLMGQAVDLITALYGAIPPLHPAQLSTVFPGYPAPRHGESAAAFRYRQRRDAAHVDGVLALGVDRRRFLHECHAFILGLPLTEAPTAAAPLVVWEGSHHIMRDAFAKAFYGTTPEQAPDLDITDIYQAARRRVFETCERVELPAAPGQALLVHRMTLHGVAPWTTTQPVGPMGRMVGCYRQGRCAKRSTGCATSTRY